MRRIICCMVGGGLIAALVVADIVQPVSVQLKEQEPNVFLVQWQVPMVFPAPAQPEPELPENCRARGERVLQEQPGTWLNRQVFRCPEGLGGRSLRIRYPFVNAGQTTMFRVDFLSGEQLVGVLNPGEDEWQVPEIEVRLTAGLWRNIRRAVLDGVGHHVLHWLHWVWWLTIGLFLPMGGALSLVGWFSLAQFVAVVLNSTIGLAVPSPLAECGLALAVVVLTSRFLGGSTPQRQLTSVAVGAGVVHGLGLNSLLSVPTAFADVEWLYSGLTVLGMDATLLFLTLVLAWLVRRNYTEGTGFVSWRGIAYACGVTAVAGVIALVVSPQSIDANATSNRTRLPLVGGEGSGIGVPGSQRVAPQTASAALQSFLSVEAFEVRHQMLIRVVDFATQLDLGGQEIVPTEQQAAIKNRAVELFVPMTEVRIDGARQAPVVDRIDFLTVGSQGVLPRPQPIPESVAEAYLGLSLVYLTSQTARQVELLWTTFPDTAPEIPATVSDPEFSQTEKLSAATPELVWENRLSEDPAPVVTATRVAPRVLPIPLVGLLLFVVVGALWSRRSRQRKRSTDLVVGRLALTSALIVAPFGEVAMTLPDVFASVPSPGEARRILAGVLPNVYRAFEFREESEAYDRLELSVTGETLSEIYLEHRRALEMEERGGARARVETVEVPTVRSVVAAPDGGFETEAVWVVGGTVTHFGHRHFRQNRYDARVSLIPVDGMWKIRHIELYDEERIR